MGLGIGRGMALGILIGLTMGNIALGPALGLPIGVAIGSSLEKKHEKELRPLTKKEEKMRDIGIYIGLGLLLLSAIAFTLIYFLR